MVLLKWWKSHSKKLPASRIVTPSRARTAPEQVENLVIMKCNMRLLREMKTSP